MKNKYLAPTLKVVEFKVEHGFVGSDPSNFTKTTSMGLWEMESSCNEESYTYNIFDGSTTDKTFWQN